MKRFMSICLAVVLLFGAFPLTATAEGGEIELAAAPLPFHDVTAHQWFYRYVRFVSERNLMGETSANTFAPEANLSRAMVVTILYRLAREPAVSFRPVFHDVSAGQWYSNAVIWAYDRGIVSGVGGGAFAPSQNITREQFAVMLFNYFLREGPGSGILVTRPGPQWFHFTDRTQISPWAEEALMWANNIQVINGRTQTTIVPGGTATRGEAAAMMMRFVHHIDGVPMPPPPPPVDTARELELRVFELTNAERVSRGLRPLIWHEGLAQVSRAHSIDMVTRGFFAHTCPSGIGLRGRVDNAGIRGWWMLAENLAGAPTPEQAVMQWMASPGHRDNILNPNLTHLGVGFHGNRWTQKFMAT